MAMQVAVSSSARSGSPAAIPAHRLDITRSTMASASVRPLPEGALLAGAWLAGALLAVAWPAGLPRRGLVFLLTASSYDPQAAELGVQGVNEVPEGDVHRFRQAKDRK